MSGARPTISYVPGSWPVLVADHAVVLAELDPSGPEVAECWAALSAGDGVDALLGRLPGARSLAMLGFEPDGLRVVVRGGARAEVVRPGSAHPLVVAADGGSGQVEQRVTGVLEIRLLAASASGQGPRLPMTSGVSLASALLLLAPGIVAPPTTPPTELVPRLPAPSLDVVTRPPEPEPPAAVPPAPVPPAPVPPAPDPTPPPAPSLPWRAPAAFVPDDDSGVQPVLPSEQPGPSADDRSTGQLDGPPAPPVGGDPQAARPRYDEPRYGSSEWAFVSPPTPAQTTAEHAAEPPMVQAVLCENGHLNAPYVVGACRVCGAPVPPQQPFATQRPTMGRLHLSSGGTIPLDRDVVLGRAPFVVDPDGSHVISVPSPNNDISRSHVRFGIDGWLVQVTDLGSTNGTLVTVPGQQPVRLRPHDPFTILPGTTVSLADEVAVLFEVTA